MNKKLIKIKLRTIDSIKNILPIITLCILITSNIFGQKNADNDSCLKAEFYNIQAEKFQLTNSDSSIKYSQKAINVSDFCDDKTLKANSLLNLGTVLDLTGSYPDALKNLLEALKIFKEKLNKNGEAKTLYRIGKICFHQSECSNDQSKIDYYNESLEYYHSALKIENTLENPSGIADNKIEIGRVLFNLNKPDSAIVILKTVLAESEKNTSNPEFIHNVAKSSYNIALIYIEQDSLQSAVYYLSKAASADSILNNKEGLAVIRIAEMYLRMGNPERAFQLASQSLDTAIKYGFSLRVMQANEILHQALSKKGKFESAYKSLLYCNKMSDSLKNDKSIKELTQLKMKHEFEKEQEIKEIENQVRLDKQKLITYSVIVILILFILFLIYGIKTYRQKQKDNIILAKQKCDIEEKNEILNQQNEEISAQRDEISAQRDEIEQQRDVVIDQKKLITDSINYASNIQGAILKPIEFINQLLPDSFIIFKPKDVVGGDFYWYKQIENKCIIVIADCTGHGVPGAFMTLIGNAGLNQIVALIGIENPALILTELNIYIKNTLRQNVDNLKVDDGMDVGICVVDITHKKLIFSGAKISLFHYINNDIAEYCGDKCSLGYKRSEDNFEFKNKEINISQNESFYMTSDGFIDISCGEKKFSLGKKKFKNMLLENIEKPMKKQGEILDTFITNPNKEAVEQRDDISVFGFRI